MPGRRPTYRQRLLSRFDPGDIKPSLGTDTAYYHDEEIVDGYAEDRRGTLGGSYIREKEDAWTRTFLERHGHDWDDLSGVTVLDVGGGPGNVTGLLAEKGAAVDYLDASPVMARNAQETGRTTGNAAGTYLVGDATNMPFEDDAYDLAVSRRTAHVIPPERFPAYLSELGRIATEGALFDMFRRASPRILYNWALPMRSTLRDDATVTAAVDEMDHVDIGRIDHDFVIPYAAFRRTDDPGTVASRKLWNEALSENVPGLASVSVYHLDAR